MSGASQIDVDDDGELGRRTLDPRASQNPKSGRTKKRSNTFGVLELTTAFDGFMNFVDQIWTTMIELKPQLVSVITQEQFRHIHALLLQRRVQDVHKSVTGLLPDTADRVPVPEKVRILSCIWSALACVGETSVPEIWITFVPKLVLPGTRGSIDNDYDAELERGNTYDWMESWDAVVKSTEDREMSVPASPIRARIPFCSPMGGDPKLGKNYGWNHQLWTAYEKMCECLRDDACFSVSFPHSSLGRLAWVLDVRHHMNDKVYERMPTASVPFEDQQLAFLIPFVHWKNQVSSDTPNYWFHKSEMFKGREAALSKWVAQSFQQKITILS